MDPLSAGTLPQLRLRKGTGGPAVAEVRDRLRRLGWIPLRDQAEPGGPVTNATDRDDEFDDEVDKAVRAFQQERGITVDGVVGPITFRRLEEARWWLGDRVLSYSPGRLTAGDDVAALQRRLSELGFDCGRVDGIFGPDTDRALREFQRNVGVDPDGTCGPAVFRALDRLKRSVTGGALAALRSETDKHAVSTGVAGKVVVLDPGHGGSDYGHVGHRLAESIIADDLAMRVEGRLAAIGTQVLISRPRTHDSEDVIDEAQRAQFANDTGADLVISLHTDADDTGLGQGVATFYWGHDSVYSPLGQHLAELVQTEIVRRTDLRDCHTHPKTWDLLRLTRMPAVRVECGYVSHGPDAQRLADSAFRDTIAEGVAAAVQRFFSPD